jgi:hypothetical protein
MTPQQALQWIAILAACGGAFSKFGAVQEQVESLRVDVSAVKDDVAKVKTDVNDRMLERVHSIELSLTEMRSDLKAVREGQERLAAESGRKTKP